MNTTCFKKIKRIARSIHSYLFPFVEKLEEAKFIESRHGKLMLLDRNRQGFTSEKKHGLNTYWQCSESRKQSRLNQEKCPARGTTEVIYVKSC